VSRERWIALDLARTPTPPDDLVPKVLTRGWVTLFSGPPAAGKSYGYQSLCAAAMNGGTWLGLRVRGIERIVVVDEENPADVVLQRLRAFGVGAQHADRLRYFSQVGCRLGSPHDPSWGEELLAIVGDFKPDLVVIDSASSATATATSENDSISTTFSGVLRPLARLGCAVLLLHHDRKAGGDVGERVLGGMQWLGQVDRQVAFEAKATRPDTWATPAGTLRASFPIRLLAGKARQGIGIPDTRASIESEQDADGSYRWVRLDVAEAVPDASRELGERILAFVGVQEGGSARLAEIASELGVARNDGRLSRALDALLRRGAITKLARGVYVAV
jgi:hypothetical protein